MFPPGFFVLALAVMVAIHVLLPGPRLLPFPMTLLGLLLVAGGLALNIAADRAFKIHNTTVKPFAPSTALVTEGVFMFSRNPMYLGMVLALAGVAVLLGTTTPYAIIVIFAVLIDRRFIRVEEGKMAASFGPAYDAYRQTVRRWV